METYQGKDEPEGRRFIGELRKLQPELYTQARNFLEQDASLRQQQHGRWQSMQESARALFTLEVWQTVLQHALVNLGVLPAVCDDLGTMSWASVKKNTWEQSFQRTRFCLVWLIQL